MEKLSGIVSALFDWAETVEKESRKGEVFTGPHRSTDSVYMSVQKSLIERETREKQAEKKDITRNRLLKFGAIGIAGIVIVYNLKG